MQEIITDKAAIVAALEQFHAGNSDPIALIAWRIGVGVGDTLKCEGIRVSRNECGQEAVVLVLMNAHRVDPGKNSFGYILTMIRNHILDLERRERMRRRVWLQSVVERDRNCRGRRGALPN